MEKDKKYTVIVPAYNEEEAIVCAIEGIKAAIDDTYEILVVDDGSRDSTFELAKKCGVRVIMHNKNRGKAAALETGVNNASGEIIVTIDADCTYEAAKMRELVKLIENGSDLAIGSRFLGHAVGLKPLNRAGNLVFSSLISLFTGQRITDAQSGLRAFRKELFYRLAVQAKGLDWETEMTARAVKEGYLVIEIPIEYYERVGKSKLHPFKDGYRMLRGVLRGTRPLSALRKAMVQKVISNYVEPGAKILYIGEDGGDLVSHLVRTCEIHYVGTPHLPIPKGIVWKERTEGDYDYVVLTNLADVVDELEVLRRVSSSLKKNGKVLIWLSNPNAHVVLSWLMVMKLLGEAHHIRYYTGAIWKLLERAGLKMVKYRKCNLRMNIMVVGERIDGVQDVVSL
jgi:hypothetical protein